MRNSKIFWSQKKSRLPRFQAPFINLIFRKNSKNSEKRLRPCSNRMVDRISKCFIKINPTVTYSVK